MEILFEIRIGSLVAEHEELNMRQHHIEDVVKV